jgi:hypothetical protein
VGALSRKLKSSTGSSTLCLINHFRLQIHPLGYIPHPGICCLSSTHPTLFASLVMLSSPVQKSLVNGQSLPYEGVFFSALGKELE